MLQETTAQNPQSLTAELIVKLHAHGLSVHAGQTLPYGQKFYAAIAPHSSLFSANIFCGEKGPTLVFEGSWPNALKTTVESFWNGKAITPRAPSPPSEPSKSLLAPEVDHPIIYVDGSYQEEELKVIGWAFQVYENGQLGHHESGSHDNQTWLPLRNVAGECTAVLRALAWVTTQNYPTVEIRYDYQGLQSWGTGAWKTNQPFTRDYAAAIKVHAQSLQILWTKVKSHSGNPGNEQADQLAHEACQTFFSDQETESFSFPTPGCQIQDFHASRECV